MDSPAGNTETTLDTTALEMLESMPMVAYAADAAGRVNRVNRRWREYTGLGSGDSLGLSGTDAIHPDDLPAVIEAWGRAVGTLTPYQLEYRLRRFDSVYRWQLGRAEPVFAENDVVLGWIGMATDVHGLKTHHPVKSESRRELDDVDWSEARLELGMKIAGFAIADVNLRFGHDSVFSRRRCALWFGRQRDHRLT
jgi:PAS domain S-box-containing protein